jgi:hypothetical protein
MCFMQQHERAIVAQEKALQLPEHPAFVHQLALPK